MAFRLFYFKGQRGTHCGIRYDGQKVDQLLSKQMSPVGKIDYMLEICLNDDTSPSIDEINKVIDEAYGKMKTPKAGEPNQFPTTTGYFDLLTDGDFAMDSTAAKDLMSSVWKTLYWTK